MVYTQLVQRQQQFHVAPTKEFSQYTNSVDILKNDNNKKQTKQQQPTNQQATTIYVL